MDYFGYILLAIVILLFMVLIHELGHYTAARILGFTVEEFSIGFGPKLFGRRRKNGELFTLRLLPLGGYCAFLGETEDDDGEKQSNPEPRPEKNDTVSADVDLQSDRLDRVSDAQAENEDLLSYVMRKKLDDDKQEISTQPAVVRLDKHGKPAIGFYKQKPWKRIIVLLGGVTFNFLSAIIFSLIYIWSVGFAAPQIAADPYTDVTGNPYNDLQKGDVILAVDGEEISVMQSFNELTAKVKEGQTVTFRVNRNGKILDIPVKKQCVQYTNTEGKVSEYVGFGISTSTTFVGAEAGNAFKYCVPYTFKLSWSILGSFGQLISGKVPITSVSGPIGSIKLMADVSKANSMNILILLPLLASNLAMFNLLPFPALDGAQVIFTIVEWIRGKPIKRKIQNMINTIGLGVLLLFVLIVDILSFAL